MLTSEVKNYINTARNILVGKIPDPKGQIDQITNALVYKFMDDQDRQSENLGGNPAFFTGELAKFAWHKLFDSRLDNQKRADLYVEGIEKLSRADNLPELFRDIFKDAFLPFRSADTIAMFLNSINSFNYHHTEELGNAFEYLLSIMGSQGDAGQFRTPRHIIEFIVNVVNPTKESTVLDPACGTAGFLVEAFKHISENEDITPVEKQELANNIVGVDIDPGMAKIARVNLYLHGFKTPQITENDTLTNEDLWKKKKYDIILANPPFMTPKGGIKPHDKFSIQANRAEVLFVDYIAEHLKLAGKAGVIVPEGIIFQSARAYKELRKEIVENKGLYAVVSLPAGVFQPYSGVKTSILFFDRELARNYDEILFLKVENDGFDLGAQRRKIEKNDLPDCLKVLESWKKSSVIPSEVEGSRAFSVKKETIAENGDYNLTGDRYRETVDYSNAKWEMVELGEVCDVLNGYAFKSKNYVNDGVRIMRITNVQKGEIVDDNPKFYPHKSSENIERYILKENDLLLSLTGNVGRVGLVKKEFLPAALNQRVACLREIDEKININYLFSVLNTDKFEDDSRKSASGIAQKNLSTEWIKAYKIPLPPLEVQEQIVAKIEQYQKVIDGAKQVVEHWKPSFRIDPNWEMVELGEVCRYEGGTQPPKSTFIDKPREDYIRLLQIRDYKSDDNIVYIPKKERHKTCTKNDIMIGRYGPPVFQILRGKEGAYNVALMKCLPDNSKITNDWLYYFLSSAPVQERIISLSERVRQSGVRPDDLNNLKIPLPPLEVQEQVVAEIEAEQKVVNANKELIEKMEQKIEAKIGEVWGDEI